VALGLAVVLVLGVASATSLGPFNQVSLWSTGYDEEACHVADPSTDVTFHDGLLGSLTSLVLDQLVLLEPDFVKLEGLAGDCDQMRPVIVVIGDHDADSGTSEQVLARVMLESISGSSPDVTLDLDAATAYRDELDALLGTSLDPNSVRLGFCPAAVTSCEVGP
jgi:hypothetical protein